MFNRINAFTKQQKPQEKAEEPLNYVFDIRLEDAGVSYFLTFIKGPGGKLLLKKKLKLMAT